MNEIVSIKVFCGYQGLREGGVVVIVNGYRGSLWDDDSGDGCAIKVNAIMPLNCLLLKMAKMIHFMLCIFYHSKNK